MSEPQGIATAETIRAIIEQVVDVYDSRRDREQADKYAEIVGRVAALEGAERVSQEVRVSRDREIKGIKETMVAMDGKLDKLVVDKAGRDGAISFGKWVVGAGFLTIIGSVIIATLHYIGWLRPPA